MKPRPLPPLLTVGFILAAGLVLTGCPENLPDPDAGSDAGADADPPALTVELGTRQETSFVSFDADQPALEVVSGFQGGYHIEPALRVEGVEADDFISVVSYRVSDAETGELLTSNPTKYRVNQGAWSFQPEVGHVRLWEQVVLRNLINPDDAAGRVVDIEVEVRVERGLGYGSESVSVLLVNDVNELR